METNTNTPEAKQSTSAGCHPTTCSPSDTPETDSKVGCYNFQGTGGCVSAQFARKLERERFTIDEIADYIAGWTLGSFEEVRKLGAHVAHNALNQLRDEQDGIKAVRLRKLYQENADVLAPADEKTPTKKTDV